MTDDDTLGLSRRKLLGGIATVGTAGAIGGAGTLAYFSDEETFANNQLVAGALDLKVDWEEHYSNWMGEETNFARMPEDGEDPDYVLPGGVVDPELVGFPTGATPLIPNGDSHPIELVFTGTQDEFWDATSIDAYPDADDDGIQDQDADNNPVFPEADSICDTDSDLSEALDSSLRTSDSIGEPLIDLQDVKPGDFGEVTLSFHLCDNPGYVWLTGALRDASENGVTEPERKDEDEDYPDGDEVELLDNVLTRIWYDDGNNQVDQITGQLDVVCVIDTSGSLNSTEIGNLETGVNSFIDELETSGADAKVGTVQFGDGDVSVTNTVSDPASVSVSLPGTGGGNTPMPGALDIADQVVNDTGAGARAGAEKVLVVFTDGGPNYLNVSYSDSGYTAPRDDSTNWSAASGNNAYDNGSGADANVTEAEMDETLVVADSIKSGGTSIATVYVGEDSQDQQAMTAGAIGTYTDLPTFLSGNGFGAGVADSPGDAFDVDVADLETLADALVNLVSVAENVFFFGTLRGALSALSADHGIPLDGDIPAEDGGGTGRNCFAASNTHHIGFEWWLPVNHANQIQTDSVSFDLGFYTEQCRHNDGSGMSE